MVDKGLETVINSQTDLENVGDIRKMLNTAIATLSTATEQQLWGGVGMALIAVGEVQIALTALYKKMGGTSSNPVL